MYKQSGEGWGRGSSLLSKRLKIRPIETFKGDALHVGWLVVLGLTAF